VTYFIWHTPEEWHWIHDFVDDACETTAALRELYRGAGAAALIYRARTAPPRRKGTP
jgi:hypothetical protein